VTPTSVALFHFQDPKATRTHHIASATVMHQPSPSITPRQASAKPRVSHPPSHPQITPPCHPERSEGPAVSRPRTANL